MPQHKQGRGIIRPHRNGCPQHALLTAPQRFRSTISQHMWESLFVQPPGSNLVGDATLVVAHALTCEFQNVKTVPRKGLRASNHVEYRTMPTKTKEGPASFCTETRTPTMHQIVRDRY